MQGLIFTLIGRDRPGIVDAVAECVFRHGGSWEESQLVRLNGQFAGIVHAQVPADNHEALRAALSKLPDIQTAVADAFDPDPPTATTHLSLVGADRRGIIQQVGRVLAERNVNMVKIETSTERAPMSGEPLFRAEATLTLPEGQSTAELRTTLEALANELMVEVRLSDD